MKQLADRLAAALVREASFERPAEVVAYGLEIILNITVQTVWDKHRYTTTGRIDYCYHDGPDLAGFQYYSFRDIHDQQGG